MRYELMFPDQIRKAIDESWPVTMAVGVLEYHSEHCVAGVDTLLVLKALQQLEDEMDIVILPPFYYGSGSYVVEPPERNGTIHIDSSAVHDFARDLFKSLLRIGFRNIHVFIHHQSENFTAGMPTDLALKLAARQVTFEFLEKERGEAWWGDNSMEDYYNQNAAGDNPFNWIQIHPFMDKAAQKKYPIDHAGKQETSLMMAFCPEGVDMKRHSEEKWYARQAREASEEYGLAAKEMILESMRNILKGTP
ncbi:unnamed protein product [marine sediment metagenome]|uniref:Creatinine amidohydrolase n=1 Tax=marine sediment metagenome TaxID=412755 RepID=X0THM7_9ZZZZ